MKHQDRNFIIEELSNRDKVEKQHSLNYAWTQRAVLKSTKWLGNTFDDLTVVENRGLPLEFRHYLLYTVSQKNCANLFSAPCLLNMNRFQ